MITALMHRYGDFDTAEDATQEALLAAARQWPTEGLPLDPKAWLVRVAARKLVDRWRADGARMRREERVLRGVKPHAGPVSAGDETLPLLLLCCHPALPPASQVALTLRALSGLSTAQIARVFLVPEATMAQRISRAKGTLRAAEVRLSTVSAAELPGRVRSALQVIYLLFTEGHTSSVGQRLVDVSTTAEAIRLAGLLHAAVPSEGEAAGLLALLLITDARRAARTGPDGALVPLAEQDRSRWDRTQIHRGVALIEQTLPHGPVGPYQLQAAIAAVHAEAVDADQTDWAQIEVLYTMLMELDPGPVVALNHAVALAHVHGPLVALERIERLRSDPGLRRQHRLPAVRAHLLERVGRSAEARSEFERAAALTTSRPEQRYLLARAAAIGPG